MCVEQTGELVDLRVAPDERRRNVTGAGQPGEADATVGLVQAVRGKAFAEATEDGP